MSHSVATSPTDVGDGGSPGARWAAGTTLATVGTMVIAVTVALIGWRTGFPWWWLARLACIVAVTTVAIIVMRRGRRWLGAVACLVAVVGLAVGSAFGIHRWSVAGWDLLTVAGLLTLVAALVLLVVGVVALGSGHRWWVSVPIGVGVVVLVAVAFSVVGPAVLATNVPPTPNGAAMPDLGGPVTDLRYPSTSGDELAAWYVAPMNGTVVVLRHGASSNRSQLIPYARILVMHGYGVLLTDARGHGESDGMAMDFGWHGDDDISAAIDAIRSAGTADVQVAVLGLSMGGEEAIGALAADDRIDAVIAEGVTSRMWQDEQWYAERYGWRGSVQVVLEWLQTAVTDVLTDDRPPTPLGEAVAVGRPVLLIAAGGVADEVTVAEQLAERSAVVTTWVVPDVGHIGGLAGDPEAWEAAVVGFLDGVFTG